MYGLGYVADPEGHRRTPFHHVMGSLAPAPANQYAASLGNGLPSVFDQNGSGSCTGHGFSCGITTFANLHPGTLPSGFVVSPDDLYKGGRAIDRMPNPDGSFPRLLDVGAMPNQVIRFANEWGVRQMVALPDRYSDVDPLTVNAEPNLAALEADGVNLVVGDYQIFAGGSDLGAQVRAAISNGIPVCVAVPGGSDAWQRYTAGSVIGATGTELDHYVCLYAYATQPDGSYLYVIRNSWGTGWGNGGDCLVNESALEEFGDVIALSIRRK